MLGSSPNVFYFPHYVDWRLCAAPPRMHVPSHWSHLVITVIISECCTVESEWTWNTRTSVQLRAQMKSHISLFNALFKITLPQNSKKNMTEDRVGRGLEKERDFLNHNKNQHAASRHVKAWLTIAGIPEYWCKHLWSNSGKKDLLNLWAQERFIFLKL